MAKQTGCLLFETSAKTGYQVTKVFADVVTRLLEQIESREKILGRGVPQSKFLFVSEGVPRLTKSFCRNRCPEREEERWMLLIRVILPYPLSSSRGSNLQDNNSQD